MKKSKKGYVIIALIVILIAIAVGYAAFSDTLTISGTATGAGTWSVVFKEAQLLDDTGAVDSAHGDEPTIAGDGKSVTASVNLSYPGDGVILDATITNQGTVPAKVTNVSLTGENGYNPTTDPDLEVVAANPATDEVLPVDGSCNVQYRIKWKTDSTQTSIDSKTFTVTFNYEQATEEFTTEPVHGDE